MLSTIILTMAIWDKSTMILLEEFIVSTRQLLYNVDTDLLLIQN